MKKILCLFLLLILTACSPAAVAPPTVTAVIATNTLIPPPTITPTATPVPNGPCDSPLLPLTTGNQWTYRVTTEGGEALYTLEALNRQDGNNIVVIVEFIDQKNNVTVNEPVVCVDGAIENFPLFVMSMHFSNYLSEDFNTYHDTGIYTQSYQTLVENNWSMKWGAEYLTEDYFNLKNPMGGSDLVVMQSSVIHLTFETDGTRETVAVPAGSFPQTLKILHSFSFPATLTLPTGGIGSVIKLDTTQWYEPYVGLIRAQVDTATLSFNQQILNLPMVSTIELVEFIPGE
jgi:hypothetical protein